jgi:hypothetical protein
MQKNHIFTPFPETGKSPIGARLDPKGFSLRQAEYLFHAFFSWAYIHLVLKLMISLTCRRVLAEETLDLNFPETNTQSSDKCQ